MKTSHLHLLQTGVEAVHDSYAVMREATPFVAAACCCRRPVMFKKTDYLLNITCTTSHETRHIIAACTSNGTPQFLTALLVA